MRIFPTWEDKVSPWLYNQIGANLTGLLIVVLALGLWRALSPDTPGRLGAGALLLVGVGVFLDGLFRLDCQGIDTNCQNDSWHSDAHKMEGRFTTAFTLLAPIILAFAFRRIAGWRDTGFPPSPQYRPALWSDTLLRLGGRPQQPERQR